MKLNKFLTTLLPIATIAAITPAVVSCGGEPYEINYQDPVDCLNEGEEGYKSIDEVKTAIKSKALIEPRGEINTEQLRNIVSSITDGQNIQYYYYDIIASHVLGDDEIKFSLSTWTYNGNQRYIDFLYNGSEELQTGWMDYDRGDPSKEEDPATIYIEIRKDKGTATDNIIHIPSYRFKDCTYIYDPGE